MTTATKRLLVGSAIIVLLGSAGTLTVWQAQRRLSHERRESEFSRESAEVHSAVVSAFRDALWTLEAIAALWDASNKVEPEEFHKFVRPFLNARQQIEALEWAPRVPRHQLAAFEQSARALHGQNFFVFERTADQTRVAVASREYYVPILFVEGRRRVARAAGWDLASDPDRSAALEQASALDPARDTGPVTLVQDVAGTKGLVAMFPVFRQGANGGGDGRSERLLGFAVGVFRIDKIVELGVSRIRGSSVDFTIHAATHGGEIQVYPGQQFKPRQARGLTSSDVFEVGGSRWIIRCDDTNYHAASGRAPIGAWLLAAGGLLTGITLVVYRSREKKLVELADANRSLEREVEERRRAQREREQMQHQVIETQKLESLGVLAGGIAHDFNNILTAVLGNAGLALYEVPADSSAARALDRVISASERAALLTRQLLAYAGKGSYRVKPLDLSALVRDMIPLLETSAPKKVRLVFELAEELPCIAADEAQLHQVLLNLVMNGAEACGEGAGQVHVQTKAETIKSQGGVVLEVTDEGCGMDEQTQARIFDPFYTTKFTGRGLGLAAVVGIVRAHGASLEVRSKPGKGSTFRLIFPAIEAKLAPKAPALPRSAPASGLSRTILVVDDEAMVLEMAQAALEIAGHRVFVAANGKQAVATFAEHAAEVDLVVLDMTMPEMNGEETLRALRRIRPEVIVLLSSGYAEDDVVPTFEEHSLAGFLQKPWLPKDLLGKVTEILDRPL